MNWPVSAWKRGTASAIASYGLSLAGAPLLLLGIAGCGGPGIAPDADPTAAHLSSAVEGRAIQIERSPELDEIVQLEEQRSLGGGKLIELSGHGDARVRRRAVVALGRLPYPDFGEEVTHALVRALEDPPSREYAAFGLGLRGDPTSAGVLAAYLNDPDPAMRARVVEAASRMDDARLREGLLVMLRDSDLGVRIEAVLATARWDKDDENADSVDRALIDTLSPYRIAAGRNTEVPTQRTAVEAELVWRILYALSRRDSQLGRGAFLEYSDSDVPLESLFAVRGLAELPADEDVIAAAARAMESGDWRVVVEAANALGAFAAAGGRKALLGGATHASTHVRASVMGALGNYEEPSSEMMDALRAGLVDVSAAVRMQALGSFVRLVPEEPAVEALTRAARGSDALDRLGAADAARNPSDRCRRLLIELSRDPVSLVATHAVDSLGVQLEALAEDEGAVPATEEARELVRSRLHELLADSNNALRAAAASALRRAPHPSDVPPLASALRETRGDASEEVCVEALEAFGELPEVRGTRELVRGALSDERSWVRHVAARVLDQSFGERPPEVELPPPADRRAPVAGENYPLWERNPLVEIATSRGPMVFELFLQEAPVHVVSFLEIARTGGYDGTLFHRVVPDFVVQGGDARGDGYGNLDWRGLQLRHEFSWRKFRRGSLGMPRTENPDSGGRQLFVTHRPTPHLDGRYTLFGELRAGGEILDAIELGDRILDVRLLD